MASSGEGEFEQEKLLTALVLAALLAPAVDPAEQPAVVAARKRQEAIRSVEFVCRVRQVMEPGGDKFAMIRAGRNSGPIPTVRTTTEWTFRIIIDDRRTRVEDGWVPSWASTRRDLIVCDGTVVKWMVGPTDATSRDEIISVIDHPTDSSRMAGELKSPILYTCRATGQPGADISKQFLQIRQTGRVVKFDDTDTIEYLSTGRNWATHYLVDPTRDHVVCRVDELNPDMNRPELRLDIRYRRDEASGFWFPTQWACEHFFENGERRWKEEVDVEKVSVNPVIRDTEFDLAFPSGIRVSDHRNRKDYRVKADGSLVEEESERNSPGTRFPTLWAWLIGGIAVLVLTAVVILVLRARRPRGRE